MDLSLNNYLMDNFLWSKFNSEIENLTETDFKEVDIEKILAPTEYDLLAKVYLKTKRNIFETCKISHNNHIFEIQTVDFHFRYGWVLRTHDKVAYLGKIKKSLHSKIEIGHFSYLSGRSRVSGHGFLKIGSFSSIGQGSNFYTSYHDHPYKFTSNYNFQENSRIRDEGHSFDTGFDPSRETKGDHITVGPDCWLGSNVTVKNAASIGIGTVVGQNSFVANELANYGVFAGTPAKLLKWRFTNSHISKLEKSCWWDWNIDEIKRKKSFFADTG